MSQYLIKLEDSPEVNVWTHRSTQLIPADLETLKAHGITTVFQIFQTHLSGGIDKSIYSDLMTLLLPHPAL
jgi:hypothetical protein